MAIPVEAPKLGNTVEECIVAKWRKQIGESVAEGDVVVEIETDKATFELPSPVGGTLLATFFEEGALVPVFTNLFVVGAPGETVDAFRPGSSGVSPIFDKVAVPLTSVVETSPVKSPSGQASGVMSPRARRFADEHDFRPAGLAGSGAGGRVLEEDVRAAFYAIAPSERKHGVTAPAIEAPSVSKISSLREKIARRMRDSLASTAQYTLTSSADAGGMLTLRARVKASKGVPDININDMVTFCTIKALLQIPDLNAEFIEGAIRRHAAVHIGFATDTSRGLMVPVVKNAHELAIGDLAQRMKDLASQAAKGSIAVDDLTGATFTISNLGGLGIESFTPLLNPPQVAILGVGAIQIKPVRKNGKLEFIDAISFSMTCDHQVIDGAPGARFLQVLKEKIENVESLCTI